MMADKCNTGPVPAQLFSLIAESKWQLAVACCKEYPAEASKWVGKKEKDQTVVWRRLPIHEACMRKPTEAVIEALLTAHPSSVTEPDHNGRLAIHHACAHGASTGVVELLIMSNPGSILSRDAWSKTPACVARGSSAKNRDVVMEMLQIEPFEWRMKFKEHGWRKENDKVIAELKRKHEAEVDGYKGKIAQIEERSRKELEQQAVIVSQMRNRTMELDEKIVESKREAENKLSTLQLEMERQTSSLQDEICTLKDMLKEKSSQKVELKGKLDDANSRISAQQTAALVSEAEHKAIVAQMEEDHQASIETMSAEHNGAVEKMKRDFDLTVATLQTEHVDATKKMQAQHVDATKKMQREHNEIQEKLEGINRSIEKSLDSQYDSVKRSLESGLDACETQFDWLGEEHSPKMESENVLNSAIAMLTAKIEELTGKLAKARADCEQKECMLGEQEEQIATLEEQIEALFVTKEDLENGVTDLMDKLDAADEARESLEQALSLEKDARKADVSKLKHDLDEANQTKEEYRMKSEVDAKEVKKIGKSSAEFYMQTSQRIEELQERLDTATKEAESLTKEKNSDRSKMGSKIQSLENTILTLITRKSEDREKAIKAIEKVEMALAADNSRHEEMMQCLSSGKRGYSDMTGFDLRGGFRAVESS